MVKIIQIISYAGLYNNEIYGLDENGSIWRYYPDLNKWVFVIESPEER
jgi:hypothetical protein